MREVSNIKGSINAVFDEGVGMIKEPPVVCRSRRWCRTFGGEGCMNGSFSGSYSSDGILGYLVNMR